MFIGQEKEGNKDKNNEHSSKYNPIIISLVWYQ